MNPQCWPKKVDVLKRYEELARDHNKYYADRGVWPAPVFRATNLERFIRNGHYNIEYRYESENRITWHAIESSPDDQTKVFSVFPVKAPAPDPERAANSKPLKPLLKRKKLAGGISLPQTDEEYNKQSKKQATSQLICPRRHIS